MDIRSAALVTHEIRRLSADDEPGHRTPGKTVRQDPGRQDGLRALLGRIVARRPHPAASAR